MDLNLSFPDIIQAILVVHDDRFGAIATVSNYCQDQFNIGHMDVSRKEKGQMALMTIEIDEKIDDACCRKIGKLPHILQVTKIAD